VPRFFIPAADVSGDTAALRGTEFRHLQRVLRLREGDEVTLFDDDGREHAGIVLSLSPRVAHVRITATHVPARESALAITLYQGVPKGRKLDLVVEKATELGVRRIAPVVSRHVVARGSRVDRWRRIAASAAEQCGRTRVPSVDAPVDLGALVRGIWPPLRILAWEGERAVSLDSLPATAGAAIAVVGPEGGFAPDEVEAARDAGFATVALAPRILRAETAAIVTATLCLHRWGDVGRLSSPDQVR